MISASSKYHVPNLERAIKIIELLAESPSGLTISQITERLKLPRNSVYRITATFNDFGYLSRNDNTKIFQITPKMLNMGYAALGEKTLVEKSLRGMRHLRDRFEESVYLGILHGNEGIVIEEVQGIHSLRYVLEPGRRFHLHTAAGGKAIVAFLPEDEIRELVQRINFTVYNERTISDEHVYLNILKRVQQDGFAIDNAEETEGMHCVGAPIFNRHGYPIASIWITGPSIRIKEKDFNLIGKELKKQTDQISKSYGYNSFLKMAGKNKV